MKKKKLFKITNSAYFQVRQLQGQLNYFSAYFDVIAVAPKGEGWEELQKQQARCIPVKMSRAINPIFDLITLFQLVKLFIKEKPTIVHSHTPKAGLLGMLAAWIARVPIRMHTVTGFPLTTATGIKKQILRFTERLTYACATNVYPNSQKMCDIICSMGIGNPKKMLVIGNGGSNGIDTAFYSRNATQDIKISTFDFTFGFVGRIFYEKEINELVASFIRLQKDYPNIGLRLIGFMEENLYPVDDWVKQEISTNSHIEFVGFQQDVRPYLMGCEAFVFPSYREGFPNVVMQAGALELPQIVTDINGCNEIIVQNKNGIIVPPQDEHALYKAMKYFLDNPNEVKRMAKNARAMITSRYERNKFWKLMLEEYYRQIKNRIK